MHIEAVSSGHFHIAALARGGELLILGVQGDQEHAGAFGCGTLALTGPQWQQQSVVCGYEGIAANRRCMGEARTILVQKKDKKRGKKKRKGKAKV